MPGRTARVTAAVTLSSYPRSSQTLVGQGRGYERSEECSVELARTLRSHANEHVASVAVAPRAKSDPRGSGCTIRVMDYRIVDLCAKLWKGSWHRL